MFIAINNRGEVTLINKKGCEVLGYNEKEIIGKNWFDFCIPEEIREEVKSVFEELLAGKNEIAEYYENHILTKDGEERIIAWHNTSITDESGQIVGTLSSGQDITDQFRAVRFLEEDGLLVPSPDWIEQFEKEMKEANEQLLLRVGQSKTDQVNAN